MTQSSFGGNWTSDKLLYLKKYLDAYTTALKKQRFELLYIDAFAGTGWLTLKQNQVEQSELPLFSFGAPPSREEDFSINSMEGSARIALHIEPSFNEYIFIEKDAKRFSTLENLRTEFPEQKITCINRDANSYIKKICDSHDWLRAGLRAVLFLDPFGMSVNWDTINSIANTKAIDLWYLFPLGVALNRLLKKNGEISGAHKRRINQLLGSEDWYDIFYEVTVKENLFGKSSETVKTADFSQIARYIVSRFEDVFEGVAPNPKMLRNKKNNPLYLLIFASGNPKGSKIAVKIAQNILK